MHTGSNGMVGGSSPPEGTCKTTMKKPQFDTPKPLVSIAEYRKLMNDNESTDERITQRLNYLEGFFRTIIRMELEKYRKSQQKQGSK